MYVGGIEEQEEGMQEDFCWDIGEIGDLCAKEGPALRQGTTDMEYYDELTWNELDPKLVIRVSRTGSPGSRRWACTST